MPEPASPLGTGHSRPAISAVPEPYVVRPELMDVLDAGHRMTVLRAPIGFGKTTAVTSWLEASPLPGGRAPSGRRLIWHDLSAPPTSAESFWTGLAADLSPLTTAAPALDPHDEGPASAYAHVRAAITAHAEPLLLVVDGLEAEVSTPSTLPSPVAEITTQLVDLLQAHPHLDLLITCRPYEPLATDAIFGTDARILDASAFTLSVADTLDLAEAWGVSLTLPQAHHLQTKVWGWGVLTRVVLQALADSGASYDDDAWEAAGDHLASLDPQGTDPELAYFIRQICILDPLTGPLAERLTGSPSASQTLETLERAGLARSHLHDGERRYTLVPAIVRAVRTRPAAAAEHAPAHRHAAQVFHDLPEHALRHAVIAQDWDLVLTIASTTTVPLVLDHPQALLSALDRVPAAQLSDHPDLVDLHAVLVRFDNDMIAPPTLRLQPETPLDAAALHRALTAATAQVIALRACHHDVAAYELVDRCMQTLVSAQPDGTTPGTAVPLFLLHGGIARCLVGDLTDAIADFERCFALSRAGGLDSVTRAAAEYSALARALTGDISGARAALDRSRAFSRALVTLHFVDVHLDRLVGALISLDQLDLQTARLLLPPAGEPQRRGVQPAWFVEAYVRAHLGLLSGDLFSATTGLGRVLRDRRTSLRKGTLSSRLLTATAATINVWGGNATRAKNTLDSIPPSSMVNAVHAEVALQMGDVHRALAITDASLAAGTLPGRLRIETLITRSIAKASQGDSVGAETDLRHAVALADPLLLRPFLAVPRALLKSCAEQVPQAARLLSRLEASGITLTPAEHQAVVLLSSSERELLHALDAGASMDVIAARLGMTVRDSLLVVGDLFSALGVHDRLGAIAAGHMLGYLGVPGT